MRPLFTLILVLVFTHLIVQAQESVSNDPHDNPDANACFDGGTMEGKCNQDFDEDGLIEDFEVQWAWECGWYMIRYDAGMFTRQNIPLSCNSLLPDEVQLIPILNDNCYIWANSPGYQRSLLYTGPANTAFDFSRHDSLTCSGAALPFDPAMWIEGIVFANDNLAAFNICRGLSTGVVSAVVNLNTFDPTAPTSAWLCVIHYFP